MTGVAPGPIGTPLIPSTFEEKVASFGADVALKQRGQPEEIAPGFVFPGLRRFILHDQSNSSPEPAAQS